MCPFLCQIAIVAGCQMNKLVYFGIIIAMASCLDHFGFNCITRTAGICSNPRLWNDCAVHFVSSPEKEVEDNMKAVEEVKQSHIFGNLFKKQEKVNEFEDTARVNVVEEMYNAKNNIDDIEKTQIINTEEIKEQLRKEEANIEIICEKLIWVEESFWEWNNKKTHSICFYQFETSYSEACFYQHF